MSNLDHFREETLAQHEQHFKELRETIRNGWKLIQESREIIARVDKIFEDRKQQ